MISPDPAALCVVLGTPLSPELLRLALTHRSWAYENGGVPTNERLEFLGDAVLGLVVTDALFTRHPDLAEGQLAKLRASVVNSRALAEVAAGIGLGNYLLLGRGEETRAVGPSRAFSPTAWKLSSVPFTSSTAWR